MSIIWPILYSLQAQWEPEASGGILYFHATSKKSQHKVCFHKNSSHLLPIIFLSKYSSLECTGFTELPKGLSSRGGRTPIEEVDEEDQNKSFLKSAQM